MSDDNTKKGAEWVIPCVVASILTLTPLLPLVLERVAVTPISGTPSSLLKMVASTTRGNDIQVPYEDSQGWHYEMVIDSDFTLDGNVWIGDSPDDSSSESGRLIIRDCTVTISQPQNIHIQDEGEIVLDNARIVSPTSEVNFEVTDAGSVRLLNGSTIDFSGTFRMVCAQPSPEGTGELIVDGGGITGMEIFLYPYRMVVNDAMIVGKDGSDEDHLDTYITMTPPQLTYPYNGAEDPEYSPNPNFIAINTVFDKVSFNMTSSDALGLPDASWNTTYNLPRNEPFMLVNCTFSELNLTNYWTSVQIYRWIGANVRDGAGVPLPGCRVYISYPPSVPDTYPPLTLGSIGYNQLLLEYLDRHESPPEDWTHYYRTGYDGEVRVSALTDILRHKYTEGTVPVRDEWFVGTYTVDLIYEEALEVVHWNTEFTSIHQGGGEAGTEESVRDIIMYEAFRDPMLEDWQDGGDPYNSYYSEENASATQTDVVIGPGEVEVYDYLLSISGNLRINGGSVKITSEGGLQIPQSEKNRYCIVVRDGASLVMEGSTVESSLPLNVYVLNNSRLELRDMVVDSVFTVLVRNSTLILDNVTIFANLNVLDGRTEINSSLVMPSESRDTRIFVKNNYLALDPNQLVITSSKVICPYPERGLYTEEHPPFLTFTIRKEDGSDQITVRRSIVRGVELYQRDGAPVTLSSYESMDNVNHLQLRIVHTSVDMEDTTIDRVDMVGNNTLLWRFVNVTYHSSEFLDEYQTITGHRVPNRFEVAEPALKRTIVGDGEMKEYWWVSVHVIDADGVPVSRASVQIAAKSPGGEDQETTTDSQGNARLPALSHIYSESDYDVGGRAVSSYSLTATFVSPVGAQNQVITEGPTDIMVEENLHQRIQFDEAPELSASISVSTEHPVVGETVTVLVYVENTAPMKATDVHVELLVDGEPAGEGTIEWILYSTKQAASITWEAEDGTHLLEAVVEPGLLDITASYELVVFNDERDIILSGGEVNADWGPSTTAATHKGNILLQGRSTLEISGRTVRIQEEADDQYRIVLVGNSTMRLSNADLSASMSLGIYLYDTSRLVLDNSTVEVSRIFGRDQCSIELTNSTLKADVDMVGAYLRLVGSTVEGGVFSVNVSTATVSGSRLELAEMAMLSGATATVVDTEFTDRGIIFNGTISTEIVNVTFPAYADPTEYPIEVRGQAQVLAYWWVSVNVVDPLGTPFKGALVRVSNPERDTGFTARTNGTGHARMKVLYAAYDRNTWSQGGRMEPEYTVHVEFGGVVNESARVNFRTDPGNKELRVQLEAYITFADRILLDVSLSQSTVRPGGSVEVTIRVYLNLTDSEGMPIPLSNASVEIEMEGMAPIPALTDSNGTLSIEVSMPKREGTYSIEVSVNGTYENQLLHESRTYTGQESVTVTVERKHVPQDNTLWIVVLVIVILVIVVAGAVLFVVIRVRRSSGWDEEGEEEGDLFDESDDDLL